MEIKINIKYFTFFILLPIQLTSIIPYIKLLWNLKLIEKNIH